MTQSSFAEIYRFFRILHDAAIMESMMYRTIFKACASLLRNRSGNVAILTALSAIPIVGMMGLAVDYAAALSTKSKLDAAADAASIAAVTAAQNLVLQSNGTLSAGSPATMSAALAAGNAAFRANAGSLSFGDPVPIPNVTYGPDPNNPATLNANVSYTLPTTNHFGQLFNKPQTTVSGHSGSSLTMSIYKNIYMALDNSQSMGIGTTQADMTRLSQITSQYLGPGNGCTFGCHVPDPRRGNFNPGQYQGWSNEQIAERNNVKLRIDTLRDSVKQVISTVQSQSPSSGPAPTQIGLYTLNTNLMPLQTVTSDFNALSIAANQIDLDSATDASGAGDSYIDNALQSLNTIVGNNGSGQTQSAPKKYVILITDGLNDENGTNHTTSAVNLANCNTLKLNSTLGIIYTTYIPAPGEINYEAFVRSVQSPPQDLIGSDLAKCATDSTWFAQASDGPAINAAIQKMIGNITQPARLTN